ncbi:glycosyltransferase family 2 protein [Candidatus Chrysopegis kryptomonas]|uniref:Glycosyltransferase, GT2 family n=1 Tax=Candidatus Chryseopegocella kryptomonas TaxID=1633643 RepID=A0A0P1MY17_9BACT|nr:glycosyltransferase family 2 protein [Candidatus Chrysopegis kryptomonas]CUT00840.1 Glycosyltransferase, GT2 family [Candidatus Chrysopegis kryptomonas]
MKRENVSAIVVTYNRKNLLIECLEALRKQTRPIQGIYLIDNASTDGTPEFLLEKGYLKELPPQELLSEPWEKEFEINNLTDGNTIKLHYVRMHENTGSAGGFHEGVKRAYEKGYDWLWLMDDDGRPEKDCLEKQMPDKSDVVTGPYILDPKSGEVVYDFEKYEKFPYKSKLNIIRNYYPITIPFNGFLLSSEVVKKVGLPERNLFYMSDDVEYSYRIIRNGFKIQIKKDAIFYHPPRKPYKYLGETRTYFIVRNRLYTILKYYGFGLKFLKNLFKFIYFVFIGHLKLRVLYIGLMDCLRNKWRNYDEVKQIFDS